MSKLYTIVVNRDDFVPEPVPVYSEDKLELFDICISIIARLAAKETSIFNEVNVISKKDAVYMCKGVVNQNIVIASAEVVELKTAKDYAKFLAESKIS